MGKTSSAVKDRWNKENYDSFLLRMSKGKKEEYKSIAQQRGKSLNQYIIDLIEADIKK